ncbi:MAG: response regulator [bacterium]|nr:response regulator [bacterium]
MDHPELALKALLASRPFGQADAQLLEALLRLCSEASFQSGQQVLEHGIRNDRIYLIVKGRASVLVDGEEILTLSPGELIGEMSVISGGPTTAEVVALGPLQILWFTEAQIRDSGRQDLQHLLDRVFLRILTDKLIRTTSKAQQYEGARKELNRSQAALKQNESNLQAQRDILDSVLRSLNEGVVVLDPAQGLLHVNAGFLRLMGREFVPTDLFSWPEELGLYLPDGKTLIPAVSLPMVTALRGEMVENLEIFVQNEQLPEGRWLLASSRPLRTGHDPKVRGSVVTFFDYTQKKAEEEALRRAKELAEAQARAQANFLSMITHELGTPLNAVIGMTDLLLQRDQIAEDVEDALLTIKDSGEGLLTMIRNLLEFQQIEAGKVQLRRELVGLRRFLESSAELIRPALREKGLELRLELDEGDLGALNLDRRRFGLVLFNLLGNALKFTHQGAVTLGCRREGEEVHIWVADTGIGITPEAQKQLFQPFTQAQSGLARKYPGLGLGLILVRMMTRAMGGEVELQSQAGQGTQVTLKLRGDWSEDRSEIKKEAANALKIGLEFAQRYPARILVAEDNRGNAKLVLRVLELLGYPHDWAQDGKEALEMARQGNYQLILMDIQMPEMDGLEATEAILRELGEAAPRILALTANSEDQVRERCFDLGMVGYLTKPLRIEQLAEHLICFFAPPQAEEL